MMSEITVAKTMPHVSNVLHFDMRVGVRSEGNVFQVVELTCDRLPWIKDEKEYLRKLTALASTCRASSAPKALNAKTFHGKSIGLLRDALGAEGICCDPRLQITFVEQDELALKAVSLSSDDPDFKVLKRREHINEMSKTTTAADITVVPGECLVFDPDPAERSHHIRLTLKKSIWLDRVKLSVDGKRLAARDVQHVAEAGDFNLPVPAVNMRDYDILRAAGTCVLELSVGQESGKVLQLSDIPVKVWAPTKAPVALFVDLGSTRAKMIAVSASEYSDKTADNMDLSAISALGADDLNRDVKGIFAHGPTDTPKFCNWFGLPLLRKDKLKDLDDNEFACVIGDAVSRLAVCYSKQGVQVSGVYWPFPKLDRQGGWHLQSLSEAATREAATSMPGKITLLWEHEALRCRFEASLLKMAEVGRAKVAAKERVERDNKKRAKARKQIHDEYRVKKERWDESFFWEKWFSSPPKAPDYSDYRPKDVPTVESFYETFIAIGVKASFRDFIIMDAGGLSLDIHGCVGKKTYSRSFEAGGELLTSEVLKWGKENGHLGESATQQMAETMKIEACRSRRELNRPLAVFCKRETQRIYSEPVREAAAWLSDALLGRLRAGVPVILSGGAVSNDFLKELIETEFTKIPHYAITSEHLAALVQAHSELHVESLPRFCLASRGYQKPTKRRNDVAFDVVAGAVESALTRMCSKR